MLVVSCYRLFCIYCRLKSDEAITFLNIQHPSIDGKAIRYSKLQRLHHCKILDYSLLNSKRYTTSQKEQVSVNTIARRSKNCISMAEFFSSYSSFMNRPFQETDLPGIQVVPQFHSKILAFTVGFSLLFKVVPTIIESTWPKWYRELDPVKRKELPTYLISLAHHFIVVPFGWWHIYQDYLIWQSDVQPFENYNALNQTPLIALGCGFLLADIINCSLPDALEGKPLYMIHHSLTVILGKSCASLTPLVAQNLGAN